MVRHDQNMYIICFTCARIALLIAIGQPDLNLVMTLLMFLFFSVNTNNTVLGNPICMLTKYLHGPPEPSNPMEPVCRTPLTLTAAAGMAVVVMRRQRVKVAV